MKDAEFKEWLEANGANTKAGRNTRAHAVQTVEKNLEELGFNHQDLEAVWQDGRFEDLRQALTDLQRDYDAGGERFRTLMPESEKPRKRLASWRSWLGQYGRFLSGDKVGTSDADRIRAYVLEHYIEPARQADESQVEFVVRDVNDALGLNDAWRNICQAMRGQKFHGLAEVPPPQSFGADMSSATRFRFDLDPDDYWALSVLRERYGDPIGRSKKMASFELSDGRQIAIDLEVAKAQLWLEGKPSLSDGPGVESKPYVTHAPRHSNLPSRLKHTGALARPVSLVTIPNARVLAELLEGYEDGGSALDQSALEKLRRRFITAFPDFEGGGGFAGRSNFHEQEDDYKRALVAHSEQLISAHSADPEALGADLLDLITGMTQLDSNLLGWRMSAGVKQRRESHPGLLEGAIGTIALADDPADGVISFLEATWLVAFAEEGNNPYGDSRTLPTIVAALSRPDKTIALRTDRFNNLFEALYGRKLFAWAPLSREELELANGTAEAIFAIMRGEWGWKPRDLWDVQGFIWIACEKSIADEESRRDAAVSAASSSSHRESKMIPTNLILYGPPGTGKTYQTIERAVALCGEQPAEERDILRDQYSQLRKDRRIEFVTFHQNFAYEEFVEGLRPQTDPPEEGGGAKEGFRLTTEPGIFRTLCTLADEARKSAATGPRLDLNGRRVFKMSLGRSGFEDEIFEDAWEGGYIVLGWGGEIDWSGYDSYEAIHERWNDDFPDTHGSNSNIAQTSRFVVDMRPGDLVIVSYGNSKIRAIGEIIGPYKYEPTEVRDYNHRREVRWLRRFDDPIDVSVASNTMFSQKSCYLISEANLNRAGLATLLPGEGGQAEEPKQFVLIIDEINRANISKVFGELITLIEPDKRLGMPNELTVRLPYSKREFGVPSNLHILGTMNTADRSIALLDTALRRRFRFEELAPDTSVPAFLKSQEETGLPLRRLLETMNQRIEYLIDREHRIGHAFFIGCEAKPDVDSVMRDKVIPLLQEYFFDDWNRLAAVLGEKESGGNFLYCETIEDPMGEGGEPLKSWRVLGSFDEEVYDRLIAGRGSSTGMGESSDG